VLALLKESLSLLFVFLLLFVAFQEFGLFLFELVLFNLGDHFETILNLLLILLLQVDHSVNVDWLLRIVTVLSVNNDFFYDFFTFLDRLMSEGSQMLDRDKLVQCTIIHEQDFFISESKVILANLLVAEAGLDLSTANNILTLQVMEVLKQVVKICCVSLSFFGLVILLDTSVLYSFMLMFGRLKALLAPVEDIAVLDTVRLPFFDIDSLAEINETLFALATLHERLGDELVTILRRALS